MSDWEEEYPPEGRRARKRSPDGFDNYLAEDIHESVEHWDNPDLLNPNWHLKGLGIVSKYTYHTALYYSPATVRQIAYVAELLPRSYLQLGRRLEQRFYGLDFTAIRNTVLKSIALCAVVVGASAGLGAAIGATAGAYLGLGVGAAPGAVTGAAVGTEAGVLLLNLLGLAAFAEFLLPALPACIEKLSRGVQLAWEAGEILDDKQIEELEMQQAVDVFSDGYLLLIESLIIGILTALTVKGSAMLVADVGKGGAGLVAWVQANLAKLELWRKARTIRRSGDGENGSHVKTGNEKPSQNNKEKDQSKEERKPGSASPVNYKSADDAAYAALKEINERSIRENREYGGLIYKNQDGTFGYTVAKKGTADAFDPNSVSSPAGTKVVGDYHTHGDYSRYDANGNIVRAADKSQDQFGSDTFSDQDKYGIKQDAKYYGGEYGGYLGTPSGKFKVYDPNKPTPSVLSPR